MSSLFPFPFILLFLPSPPSQIPRCVSHHLRFSSLPAHRSLSRFHRPSLPRFGPSLFFSLSLSLYLSISRPVPFSHISPPPPLCLCCFSSALFLDVGRLYPPGAGRRDRRVLPVDRSARPAGPAAKLPAGENRESARARHSGRQRKRRQRRPATGMSGLTPCADRSLTLGRPARLAVGRRALFSPVGAHPVPLLATATDPTPAHALGRRRSCSTGWPSRCGEVSQRAALADWRVDWRWGKVAFRATNMANFGR